MFTLYFKTKDNSDKQIIGQRIHEALKGSKCYIDNDVILNIDEDNAVLLTIGDDNGHNLDKIIDCTEWDLEQMYKQYLLDMFNWNNKEEN